MSKKDDKLIELFRKITYLHFLTDYSSIDFQYPPIFIWDEFNNERFTKIKKISPQVTICSMLISRFANLNVNFVDCFLWRLIKNNFIENTRTFLLRSCVCILKLSIFLRWFIYILAEGHRHYFP